MAKLLFKGSVLIHTFWSPVGYYFEILATLIG